MKAFDLAPRACHQRLVRFARDRRGVSAVEFAMLLPLMLTLYLGTVEISQGVAHRPQGDADDAHGRGPGVAGVEHQQRRHDQHSQRVVCGDRALSTRPS